MAVVLKERILRCDGYEMFRGSFLVKNANGGQVRVGGDWLHIPKEKNDGYDIWYVQNSSGCVSYPADILGERVVY